MPDNDISLAQGQMITAEAATWEGTAYAMMGARSAKGVTGDCSGTTWLIYKQAGFDFDYTTAAGFPAYAISSGHFRKLGAGEAKRDGDILSWSGHMAIYCTFGADRAHATTQRPGRNGGKAWTQENDMWTASRTGGPAYAPFAVKYWQTQPTAVFRYQKAR